MNISLLILAIVLLFILLWVNILGTIALKNDLTLESFQRYPQLVVVWLIPYFGAALILHLLNQQSPQAIPRKLVPWPLKSWIFGKERPKNKNRDDNDNSGIDLAVSSKQHDAKDYTGGIDGGD